MTRLDQALRDWGSALFPPSWYVQAGTAIAVLGALLGLQGQASWMAEPGSARHTPPVTAVSSAAAPAPADGEEIYNTRCVSCHQMNGQGVPRTFPPLNGTEWVNGDKGRLIRLLLHGIQGKIKVKGQTYSGAMPPWGDALSNEEIAQVATYIRSNFGNDAPPVTTEEVAEVREATTDRSKPWTAEELNQEANQGIPGDSTASE